MLLWNPPRKQGGRHRNRTDRTDHSRELERTPAAADTPRAEAEGSPSALQGQLVDARRRSAHVEAACILGALLRVGLRVLAFCRDRRSVELVAALTQALLRSEVPARPDPQRPPVADPSPFRPSSATSPILALAGSPAGSAGLEGEAGCTSDEGDDGGRLAGPALAARVAAYRAGYDKRTRRRAEAGLFAGWLRGCVSTSALELGVDLGRLDAVLTLGMPPALSALWQQAGRAGRRARPGLAVLVARDSPLDQCVLAQPRLLFAALERAVVDVRNARVLQTHLLCAAFEAPLEQADARFFSDADPDPDPVEAPSVGDDNPCSKANNSRKPFALAARAFDEAVGVCLCV